MGVKKNATEKAYCENRRAKRGYPAGLLLKYPPLPDNRLF